MQRRTFCQVAGLALGSVVLPSSLARAVASLDGTAGPLSFGLQVATKPSFEVASLMIDISGLDAPTFELEGLQAGLTYYWRANAARGAETSPWSAVFNVTAASAVDAARPEHGLPIEYDLGANYPNPFNPTTTIPFAVSTAGPVRLRVYNMLGQEVAMLVDDHLAPGHYDVTWEARDFASGTYFTVLQAGTVKKTRTMILQK